MRFSAAILLSLVLSAPAQAQFFGAVYTMSNDTTSNEVDVHLRLPSGRLFSLGSRSTGGTGTGGGLGSQGALAASRDGRTLLAVNPGSDEVTMFRVVFGLYLWRLDTDKTGGTRPTSVAVRNGLVYVLNAGSDTVTGFRIRRSRLEAIPGASYDLSQAGAAAAQVGFSPDGRFLVVTERATNMIGVFPVQRDGTLGTAKFQAAAGMTPFGFLFRNDGVLVVSEAAGGNPNASVASSYELDRQGDLTAITGAVPTQQTAACWIAIPRNGRFAYTTNTGGGTVTGFEMNRAGALTRLDANGVTGDLGATSRPLDFDFTGNGRFLYVLDSGEDEIRGFYRRNDGSLVPLSVAAGLVDGSAGLLAR